MAWINLAATRFRLQEEAEYLINRWERATELSSGAMKPVLRGLQVGDPLSIARAKALSHRLLAMFYSDVEDCDLLRPEILPNIVGLGIVAQMDGTDQTELWERIAKSAQPPEPLMRILKIMVSRLLEAPAPLTEKLPTKPGQVYRESDWIKLLRKTSVDRLFDLAASPDHPFWGYTYESFVLPLGLLLHRALGARNNPPDIYDIFRRGAHPARHPHVVFERLLERPPPLSVPEPSKPKTWFGFDAIEIRDHTAYVYHYLGLSWQAPLVFERTKNAYHFLDSVELSWKAVENALSAHSWEELKVLRDEDACVHVVVHDETKAPAPMEDLRRAAKHYGIRLEVCDLMLA